MPKVLNRPLITVALVTLAGLISSILYHAILSRLYGSVYPNNSFLFLPSVRFTDFMIIIQEGSGLNPYLAASSAQYPLLPVVGFIMSQLGINWFYLMVLFFALVTAGSVFTACRYCRLKLFSVESLLMAVTLMASYPYLFVLDRGNFDILIFLLLLVFIYLLKIGKSYQAATVLAIATSMKLYPVYFSVLLIRERRYRETVLYIILTVAVSLFAISLFKGGISANIEFLLSGRNMTDNYFFNLFTSNLPVAQRSVSIFNAIKILIVDNGLLGYLFIKDLLGYYKIAAAVAALFFAWVAVFRIKENWKAVLLCSGVIIVIPYISADYKMLHFLLPVIAYCDENLDNSSIMLYPYLFGFLMIPKSYYMFNVYSENGMFDISLYSVLNPLILLALMIYLSYQSFTRPSRLNQFA